MCPCVLGGTPSRAKPEYWGEAIAWINFDKVNAFRIIESSEMITEIGLNNSMTKLLPAKTPVIAMTGTTLGQVSLFEIDACANESVVGVLQNKDIQYTFLYPFILDNIEILISLRKGVAQQYINKQDVESLELSLYQQDVIIEYNKSVSPIFEMISSNCFKIAHLAKISDTLLPKLMSGELSVADI